MFNRLPRIAPFFSFLPLRLQFEFLGTGGDDDCFAAVEDHGLSALGRYDPATADGRQAPDRWRRVVRTAELPGLIEFEFIHDKMGRRHQVDLRLASGGFLRAANDLACPGSFPCRLKSLGHVQFARASVIIETVGGVGILLCLDDDRSRPDGMHGSGIHVDHIALVDVNPVEQRLQANFRDGAFHLGLGDSGFKAQPHLRPRLGAQDIPALRLAACLTDLRRAFIIRMHLYRKLFPRKKKLDQQRKALRAAAAQQIGAERPAEFAQRAPGQRAVGDGTAFAGEPYLADGVTGNFTSVVRRKTARTPYPLLKYRAQQQWIEIGHWISILRSVFGFW